MEITHQPDKKMFEMEMDGYRAYASYELTPEGGLDIRHTWVPSEIGGRGIASQLMKAAYDYAVANHLKPIATCSYAVVWLQRHPEYQGEVGADYGGEGTCAL